MAISFVNAANGSNNSSTAGTSIATSAFNAVAGNLLFVICRAAADPASFSITDTANNTWIQIGSTTLNTGMGDSAIFYAKNISGNASNVVTAHFASAGFSGVTCIQFSGCDTSSPLDLNVTPTNVSGSASNTVTSGSFTTAVANEVIIAAAHYDKGNLVAGAIGGTTATIPTNGDATSICGLEYRIVSAIQTTQTAAISSNGAANYDWLLYTVSFKQASATTIPNSSGLLQLGVG